MANILKMSHNDIPDARVEKESRALIDAGHLVYLVAPKIRNKIAKESFTEVYTYSFNFKHYFSGPIIRDAIKFLKEIIKKHNISLIHAHNIICINLAMKLIKKSNIKLIFDDHETWSLYLQLRMKSGLGFRKFLRWILLLRAQRIEKLAARKSDHIIVTNRKCIDFYLQKYKIRKNSITEIENIALQEEIDTALKSDDLLHDFFKKDKRKKIVHVYRSPPAKNPKQFHKDTLTNRNYNRIIDAQEKLEDWVLVLFGKRNPELEKRGVVFIEYLPRIAYLANISKGDVGINPLVVNAKTSISSQNRIFEYAKLGVRIISTRTQLLKENFEDKLIWFNPEDELDKLVSILENINKYPTGKELQEYSKKFSWEEEIKKAIKIYEALLT
jgi:glycosyltransferase involved in cell wall biosynthesis